MHCIRLRSTLALVALLTLATLPTLPVRADTTVTDLTNAFSIQVPDSWIVHPPPVDDTSRQNILISYDTPSPNGGPQAFTGGFQVYTLVNFTFGPNRQQITQFLQGGRIGDPVYTVQNGPDVTVGGESGMEFDFTVPDGAGNPVAIRNIFVPHGGIEYWLAFQSQPADSDALRPAVATILTSWQWLK